MTLGNFNIDLISAKSVSLKQYFKKVIWTKTYDTTIYKKNNILSIKKALIKSIKLILKQKLCK